MIPQDIADFIAQPGLPMSFGTRDAGLQTSVSHAFALKLSDNKKDIRFIVPKIAAGNHLNNLQQNGRVAFTIGHPVTHVCYQLKGKYVSYTDCTTEDMNLLGKNFAAFTDSMAGIFGEHVREILGKLNFGEFLSITFSPEEIFDQTPGPGAGKKLL